MSEKLLAVAVVAKKLGVSHMTVRRMMRNGCLKWTSHGVSKGYLVYESSVEDFKKKRAERSAYQL